MTAFSREEFLELARHNPWTARDQIKRACHLHKGDYQACLPLLSAAMEAMPNIAKNTGAADHARKDIAIFCMAHLDQAIQNEDADNAFLLISMTQKIMIENARRNKRYRAYILERYEKLAKLSWDKAQDARKELVMMCDGDVNPAADLMAVTQEILFSPDVKPTQKRTLLGPGFASLAGKAKKATLG